MSGTPHKSRTLAWVDEQYRLTEERLANDPEWIALKEAAKREAAETPDYYLARNMLALRREIETPLWGPDAE